VRLSIRFMKFTQCFVFLFFPNLFGLVTLALWRMTDPKVDLFSQILCISILVFFTALLLNIYVNKSKQQLRRVSKKILFIPLVMALIFYNLTTATLINIDRSRSFYVLAWLDAGLLAVDSQGNMRNFAISKEAMNMDAISERLEEHRGRLFVTNDNRLSLLGKETVKASNFLARVFSLDGWFRNSK
jgi:hypothetical protein